MEWKKTQQFSIHHFHLYAHSLTVYSCVSITKRKRNENSHSLLETFILLNCANCSRKYKSYISFIKSDIVYVCVYVSRWSCPADSGHVAAIFVITSIGLSYNQTSEWIIITIIICTWTWMLFDINILNTFTSDTLASTSHFLSSSFKHF